VVGKDGEDVQELLHEHSPLLVGRLRPNLVHVQLAEDAESLIEAAGDLRTASRFLSRLPVLVAEDSPLHAPRSGTAT
jgi:hypothetical protein